MKRDNAGQTALMRASQAGQTDVVKVLLAKGANPAGVLRWVVHLK